MSDDPLEQLSRLRAHAVDEARLALREAEAARAACRDARDAALATEAAHDRALAEARTRFSAANSVAALRWAARGTEARLARRERDRILLAQREHQLQEATARVQGLAQALRARELERRAVARTLARRAQAVMRRTEICLEDEAEDALRARAY